MAGMVDLLEDLDEEQRAAALEVVGPVCIVAGAGTGKTRTVTYRLAHAIHSGAVEAGRALAITHSRKAAGELSERLGQLGVGAVEARTFHAAGLRVARQYWARTGRPELSPRVLSEGEAWRMWRDSLRAATRRDPGNLMVRDLIDEVGWARSRLLAADVYPAAAAMADRHPGLELSIVVECWERYSQAKARLGQVDFADLLDIASTLLEDEMEVAVAVRGRWAHVTVDEYQDTDPAQQRLLDAILGDGTDVCVVGDPRQAIYSWKGADPIYLTGFAKRYPTARVFDLTRNYRSSAQILAWANRLARGRQTRPLVATRSSGPAPRVTQLDTETGEAAWVAGAVRRAMASGTPVSEIAVLYRFNATQARFEAALARAEIPTVVADDIPFFERDEIRSVLVPYGQAARAQPESDGLHLLTAVLARAGFDRDDPPGGLGAARARWESRQALLDLVEAVPAANNAGAMALLDEINAMAIRTHGPRNEGVTLATLHRAKGLEWDLVFVVGATDGAIPSTYADTPSEKAEEERLLHVGVTRARRELHLTWPASSARGWSNRPSPFLDLLATSALRPKGSQQSKRRARPRSTSAEGSRTGPSCPHCADALKGLAARRLGVCANCAPCAPGDIGRRARALGVVIARAAQASGVSENQLVGRTAVLRLLDRRPITAEEVTATVGVNLRGAWAAAAAAALSE
jgi:DNA helicase II / ATP-dependent DNA helicase PcrA